MKVEETPKDTANIIWDGGSLEINLVPANKFLTDNVPKTVYSCARWENRLIYVHDSVGIVNLQLDGCSPVPRICWDNREHHFWQGFSGGFEPRNTIVNDPGVFMEGDYAVASFYYIANFVKTSVRWVFSEPSEHGCLAFWDTFFTIENLSRNTLENYMTFFASYHQSGKNYYWSLENGILECAELFCGYSEFDFEKKKSRDEEIKKDYREIVKGWSGGIENPSKENAVYRNPVLLSGPKNWYARGHHIIFVEPAKCLSIVSAANQARDYTLVPPGGDLQPGEAFTARVRHIIAKIETLADLEKHWDNFEHDIAEQRGCNE